MTKGSCVCGVVVCQAQKQDNVPRGCSSVFDVVVLLETSLVLHYKSILVVGKWVGQVILHSFGLTGDGAGMNHDKG